MNDIRQRLKQIVDHHAPAPEELLAAKDVNGDHHLNGTPPDSARLRLAAVLVPIIARPAGPTVLLTVRASHLPKHAGQIAFPGGKVEAHDASPFAAALRETREEVGIAEHYVDILGSIDVYQTVTDFRVLPVVGWLDDAVTMCADDNEVAEMFEVPLAYVLDRENHRVEHAQYKGQTRRYYVIEYEGRAIWGATAGMIRNLTDRLGGDVLGATPHSDGRGEWASHKNIASPMRAKGERR